MSRTALTPLKSGNLSEQVYEAVRNALVEGMYEPGEKLTIAELALELGVSITPVRETIFRLVSERALEMKAATAINVPELTPDQFREIQRIGILLEGEAAEVAAEKITPQQLKSLEDIQEQLVEAARGNRMRAARLNRRFHGNVMAAADMPLVHATVENMWALKGPILRIYQLEMMGKAAMEQHDHYDVLDGLRNGDGGKAREAIQRNIAGCNDMIAWIKERQKEAGPSRRGRRRPLPSQARAREHYRTRFLTR